MFFCGTCQKENKWPESISTSFGKCEVCDRVGGCFNVPSKNLPEPPKTPQTWSIPAEPGPEVTHVKDRYRDVWRRRGPVWIHESPHGEASWQWPILFGRGYPLTDVSAEYTIDNDNPSGLAW